jgi:hypothetical protein
MPCYIRIISFDKPAPRNQFIAISISYFDAVFISQCPGCWNLLSIDSVHVVPLYVCHFPFLGHILQLWSGLAFVAPADGTVLSLQVTRTRLAHNTYCNYLLTYENFYLLLLTYFYLLRRTYTYFYLLTYLILLTSFYLLNYENFYLLRLTYLITYLRGLLLTYFYLLRLTSLINYLRELLLTYFYLLH